MRNIIKPIQDWVIQNIINSVWGRGAAMIASSTVTAYLASITEAIKPWLPFGYYIAIVIGIIIVLNIRLLLLKSKKQKIESISEEKIVFSDIHPYCNFKNGIPRLGIKVVIINSSIENIYCSIDSEVSTFSINSTKNPKNLIGSDICIHPYSYPKTFNCLEMKIQDIKVYQEIFKLEFHIALNFYKNKEIILFTKKCHYKATCSFVQDAVQRNCLHLEIHSVECNDVPEIQSTQYGGILS